MKSLRAKILVLIILIPLSVKASDLRHFYNMTYTQMIKASSNISSGCSKKSHVEKTIVKDLLSTYLNEVAYRCLSVSKYSKEATTCKLTEFRLKSDYLECDKDNYYYNKIERYYYK